MSQEPTTPAARLPFRLASLDTYRGFVLLLMMAELLNTCVVATRIPTSTLWAFICHHQHHVPWVGCSLHDLIQPSFTFLVGVALPFSLASRSALQHSRARLIGTAFRRAAILVLLGVLLRFADSLHAGLTFQDTLAQIGLGYGFLFLLALRPVRDQWVAFFLILVVYWAAFAAYSPDSFDPIVVGTPHEWPYWLTGFQAHWNRNANLAWRFDVALLNFLPRARPFVFNDGGYATLSFIPSLATMILGLLAGGILRSDMRPASRMAWFVSRGMAGLALGLVLGTLGVCPIVKRIWTPSFVLFSGGFCLLFLAGFHELVDRRHHKRWAYPLRVLGTNSLATYCLYELVSGRTEHLRAAVERHASFLFVAFPFERMLEGAVLLVLLWLVLFWMYRRRIFIRI